MNTPKNEEMARAIRLLANAITPTNVVGSHDETGGFVTSHTEAVMGLTAAMMSIANSISELAIEVRRTTDQLIDELSPDSTNPTP